MGEWMSFKPDTEEVCYRYRAYDMSADDYVYLTRYATMHKINQIKADDIHPGRLIDKKYINDGWTKKGFDPDTPA
jgi:hypothetical protein